MASMHIFFCLSDDSNYLIAWAKAGLGLAVIPESAEAIARHEGLACVRMDDPGADDYGGSGMGAQALSLADNT